MLLPRFFSHASAGTTVSSGADSPCVLDENKAAEPLPTLVCLLVFSLARSCALHYVKDQLLYHRRGPHMRSLISIDFPAPEMEPESAHVASAVSVP